MPNICFVYIYIYVYKYLYSSMLLVTGKSGNTKQIFGMSYLSLALNYFIFKTR